MALDSSNPADAGKKLRLLALTTPADKLGFAPDDEYPIVYGVVTDWNLDSQTASIVAMRDGTASLYTTSSFGIVGGEVHDAVRKAAQEYVKVAGRYFEKSVPVYDYPYPEQGKVNYFLLTYYGVRFCVGDVAGIDNGSDQTAALFEAAQKMLTALRLAAEPQGEENAKP